MQTLVEQCASDDTDTDFNMGCVLFKVCTLWPHVHVIQSLLLLKVVHSQFTLWWICSSCSNSSLNWGSEIRNWTYLVHIFEYDNELEILGQCKYQARVWYWCGNVAEQKACSPHASPGPGSRFYAHHCPLHFYQPVPMHTLHLLLFSSSSLVLLTGEALWGSVCQVQHSAASDRLQRRYVHMTFTLVPLTIPVHPLGSSSSWVLVSALWTIGQHSTTEQWSTTYLMV